ncbi:uncharacterized protein DUF2490 [Chitinophaga skermanii]|uniref:Uncharacterized protein DUF2490 n=1 Tax=Chitinophaga skermanii TaxID=331697 RepID=A0A327R362_9BACT|nr:DUF2490 domain-containing protein [Chitinophaga skermanii]RAJ10498.1 uncharacterized protein DUF2490 [Chitinophaga skermanii]
MIKRELGLLVIAMLLVVTSGKAQVSQNYQHWYTYFGTAKINDKFSIPFDVQLRIRNGISDKGQILTRGGLQYSINKRASALLGYAYVTTYTDPLDTWFPEHRMFEQFIYKTPIRKWDMTHRFRLEQRWVGVKGLNAEGEKEIADWRYGNRLRYWNRSVLPLSKKYYFVLQDELFMNLWGNDISNKFYDQNRFLAAVGYNIKSNLKVDVGYMNQFIQAGNGSKTMNHILHIGVFHNFDL